MKIDVKRKLVTHVSTIGELLIDGTQECLTLEDPIRDKKIPRIIAIPAGTYVLKLEKSQKFGRKMPHLLNVPNFTGILIHWGNTAKDTEGCILVGQTKLKDFIGSSKATFDALYQKLSAAEARGETISISISNP